MEETTLIVSERLENMKMEHKSSHGGAREGAGRKPKLQYEARGLFYSTIDDRWDMIVSKLDELIAKGDSSTLRWLLEQRIGRAPQSIDITTQGDKITPDNQISEDAISIAEDLLKLKLVEGIDIKEAMQRFRE